jgi:hypothetical protein
VASAPVSGSVWRGLEGFDPEAAGQLAYFDARSPSHARFLRLAVTLLTDDARVRGAVHEAWGAREFHARYERALLLCAAVRFDALRDPTHPLARGIGSEPTDPRAITLEAVRDGLLRPTALASMSTRFVQTNEVTRACVWRLPLGIIGQGRRCTLVDIGCSAGLNLVADRIDVAWTDEDGSPIRLVDVDVVQRVGFDRAPIDVRDDDALTWLSACVWPGQVERLRLLEAAAACARDARSRGQMSLEAADLSDVPGRIAGLSSDTVVYAYQTIVRDYLLPEVARRYDDAMRAWLIAHPNRAAWAELERAPQGAPGPTEIRVHFAHDGRVRTLAVASGDYHPGALRLDGPALAELRSAFDPTRRLDDGV